MTDNNVNRHILAVIMAIGSLNTHATDTPDFNTENDYTAKTAMNTDIAVAKDTINIYRTDRYRYSDKHYNFNTHDYDKGYFLEYGVGAVLNTGNTNVSFGETFGHTTGISIGKMIDMGLGVRVSYMMSQSKYGKKQKTGRADQRTVDNTSTYHNVNSAFYAEVIAAGNNDKTKRFNYYLFTGLGLGWLNKFEETDSHSTSLNFSFGGHFFYKITPDLQAFVEPAYSRYLLSSSGDVSTGKLSLRLGVTKYFREYDVENMRTSLKEVFKPELDGFRRWDVGAGCGFVLGSTKYNYDEGYDNPNWAAQVYGRYRFNRNHGVRLTVDMTSREHYTIDRYKDVLQNESYKKDESDMKFNTRNLSNFIVTPAYCMNLTNMFLPEGEHPIWNYEAFIGPSLYFGFVDHSNLVMKKDDTGKQNYHFVHDYYNSVYLGLSAGIHVARQISNHFSIYASPTFFMFKHMENPAENSVSGLYLVQHINFGLEYKF